MDKSSFGGVLIAMGGILAGMMMEGGKIGQILQPTAALIVLGGTLGAVMLQFPLATVLAAAKGLARVFFSKELNGEAVIAQLVSSGVIYSNFTFSPNFAPIFVQALELSGPRLIM